MREHGKRYRPDPWCLDEVTCRAEVVVNGDLYDVARYIGATRYQDLRGAYTQRGTWNRSEKAEKTHVDDFVIENPPSA